MYKCNLVGSPRSLDKIKAEPRRGDKSPCLQQNVHIPIAHITLILAGLSGISDHWKWGMRDM